ncbi:hypothetical protein ACO0SA_002960 [Hanseniaspora valbyensis]
MSWDDEDFEVSVTTDEPILESWDDDFADDADILAAKKPEPKAPAAKASTPAPKKKTSKKNGASEKKVLLEIDTLDPKTRAELMRKAELAADLDNATDLFEGLGVSHDHPKAKAIEKEIEEEALLKKATFSKETPIESHPLFTECESKKDWENLRKALSQAVLSMNEVSALNYSSLLAIDLIRDVAKPLTVEQIRQTIATLTVFMKDKERKERQARLAKVKGGTASGGAGKKKAKGGNANLGGAMKKNQDFDISAMDDSYNDFGDDDFM